jgi:predicted nucleic acid-binding protein
MYLLDTNVVSELRKIVTGRADRRVVEWNVKAGGAEQFISVVTILELETGVLRMERRDLRQGAILRGWLTMVVLPEFKRHILPVDLPIVLRCAELHVPNPRPERDAYLAATALVHGLTVVTRNVADFAGTGVRVLNPWEPSGA